MKYPVPTKRGWVFSRLMWQGTVRIKVSINIFVKLRDAVVEIYIYFKSPLLPDINYSYVPGSLFFKNID